MGRFSSEGSYRDSNIRTEMENERNDGICLETQHPIIKRESGGEETSKKP